MDLLKFIIVESEKAANVARLCRQNEHLFELLIQEKCEDEGNPRFVRDFKTLADVLIQEMVKHDFQKKISSNIDRVKGEENNTFSNKLGETITVEIKSNPEETAALLEIVLNGDKQAANLLAIEVHKDIFLEQVNTNKPEGDFKINQKTYQLWIDPIDSTAEYINGIEKMSPNGITISGLKCVTVLIGVYDNQTGLPVMGVINQPFLNELDGEWSGGCIWGVYAPTTCPFKSTGLCSTSKNQTESNVICISSSEDSELVQTLKDKGYELVEAAGAGYKILAVITGLADAYILSKDSTYKWDTCGPHAILKSMGGHIFNYQQALQKCFLEIRYNDKNNCNVGGIFAYRNAKVFEVVFACLRQKNK